MDDETAPDLRERRRRETLAEISEAALALFERAGFDSTTVDDIAKASGVSVRTCFRYFPTKDSYVFVPYEPFDVRFDAWLADVDRERPLVDQLEEVHESAIDYLASEASSADLDRMVRVRRLVSGEPNLKLAAISRDIEHSYDYIQRVQAAFDGTVTEREARLALEVVGSGLRAAFDEWFDTGDPTRPEQLVAIYADVRRALHALISS